VLAACLPATGIRWSLATVLVSQASGMEDPHRL
jgi:hypothetical protein